MSGGQRGVIVGVVGRAHGRDGSFYVERADHPLEVGTELTIGERAHTVERRAGTDQRPLVRLSGVKGREQAAALRGEELLVRQALGEDEWLASDLLGCRVEGMGEVRRVIGGPSCDVLELEDGTLVPLVSDAVRHVDPEGRRIEVDLRFLGLEPE